MSENHIVVDSVCNDYGTMTSMIASELQDAYVTET